MTWLAFWTVCGVSGLLCLACYYAGHLVGREGADVERERRLDLQLRLDRMLAELNNCRELMDSVGRPGTELDNLLRHAERNGAAHYETGEEGG